MAVTLKGQTAVYEGVSTDTKPTDADNNAIFKELDTGIRYYYDGADWNEIPSSGGGGGGTGTDNYNELNNKPSINSTVLSGNKSLDNLGIQAKLTFDNAPTSGSSNPVKSGGVYSALESKQDTISDLSTIRSGAAAGATAVQPSELETVLTQKQDALSSQQLDAVNSGITSADVEQITTNKNNILYNANQGVKNIFDFDSWYNSLTGATRATITATTNGITLTATGNDSYTTPQINGYHIPVKPNTSYTVTLDSSDSNGQLVFLENDGFSKVYVCETGTKTLTFTTSATADRLSVRFGVPTSGNASTITNIMVQLASISDTTYQPYALSNAELTAAIQAIQAQLANQ